MPKSKRDQIKVLSPEADMVPPTSTLPMVRAIFIYEDGLITRNQGWTGWSAGRQMRDRVITSHEVSPDGTLGPAALFDPIAFADSIVDAEARQKEEQLTFQSDCILAQGRGAVVWWRPAGPAKLYFKTADDHPELTALNGREIPLPALVFRGSTNHGLKVWALMQDARPKPDTLLYGAPFMNIGGGGPNVCLGSARSFDLRNATARASAPSEWERVFFESNFTHTPPTLVYEKGQDYSSLLAGLAEQQANPPKAARASHCVVQFPTQVLRLCNFYPTLAHAISGKAKA